MLSQRLQSVRLHLKDVKTMFVCEKEKSRNLQFYCERALIKINFIFVGEKIRLKPSLTLLSFFLSVLVQQPCRILLGNLASIEFELKEK